MFLASERTLDVPCHAARARLVNLVNGGGLNRASHTAYQKGLKALIRVGPLGDLPGTSKLVEVRFVEPVERDGVTTTGLRWEATGATAGLFPVLDANITLSPDGDRTRLRLAGAYRPPLGRLGAGLDKAILHRIAAATIRALLTDVASALATPATAAGHTGPPPYLTLLPAPPSPDSTVRPAHGSGGGWPPVRSPAKIVNLADSWPTPGPRGPGLLRPSPLDPVSPHRV